MLRGRHQSPNFSGDDKAVSGSAQASGNSTCSKSPRKYGSHRKASPASPVCITCAGCHQPDSSGDAEEPKHGHLTVIEETDGVQNSSDTASGRATRRGKGEKRAIPMSLQKTDCASQSKGSQEKLHCSLATSALECRRTCTDDGNLPPCTGSSRDVDWQRCLELKTYQTSCDDAARPHRDDGDEWGGDDFGLKDTSSNHSGITHRHFPHEKGQSMREDVHAAKMPHKRSMDVEGEDTRPTDFAADADGSMEPATGHVTESSPQGYADSTDEGHELPSLRDDQWQWWKRCYGHGGCSGRG